MGSSPRGGTGAAAPHGLPDSGHYSPGGTKDRSPRREPGVPVRKHHLPSPGRGGRTIVAPSRPSSSSSGDMSSGAIILISRPGSLPKCAISIMSPELDSGILEQHGPEGSGDPSRSPASGGCRGGGDEFRRIQSAPPRTTDSRAPSQRFANEMAHRSTKTAPMCTNERSGIQRHDRQGVLCRGSQQSRGFGKRSLTVASLK